VQINKDGVQKQSKLSGLFSLTFFLFSSLVMAQGFEDFKRMQHNSFSAYRNADDSKFSTYLKSQWKEFQGEESAPLYEKKKPKSITPTVQKRIKSLGPRVRIDLKKTLNTPKKVQEVQKTSTKDINLIYFGQRVGVDRDDAFKEAKFYPPDQNGVSNFFATLASSDYEVTLSDIKNIVKHLNLNDWGLYLLVNKVAESIYSNPDDRKLFSWFVFNKLGYAVKVGLSSNHIILMFYSEKIIYSTPNYELNHKKFYVLSNYAKEFSSRIYTYKQNYPQSNKAFDLALTSLPNFLEDMQTKTLNFSQLGKEYRLSYSYDKNLIDFMATYPQADYETFFNAPMQSETYKNIAKGLRTYIDGKSSSVALNFVLNFVQKAFIYEVDQKQFAREKVMFAQETLFYSKSDCEDRAILFSYLVKELFGISVIGVKYKDHMATALYIPMRGDSVKKGRRKFVIADPTYINANIGQSMPKYKAIIPESFIVVKRGK